MEQQASTENEIAILLVLIGIEPGANLVVQGVVVSSKAAFIRCVPGKRELLPERGTLEHRSELRTFSRVDCQRLTV